MVTVVEQAAMELMHEPAQVRLALSPLRRQLLALLTEPMSATQLAVKLGVARQKVDYHLRLLETAGLVELVEERQRRGCVERIMPRQFEGVRRGPVDARRQRPARTFAGAG